MRTFLIRAKTDKGRSAIKKHLKETKKMPLRQKMIFKTAGYKQEVISEKPYTLKLEVKNKHAEKATFLMLIQDKIIEALQKNGAAKDLDFFIEVK